MRRSRSSARPTVYICVEIKNRELDSQVLLAANLVQNGFRCVIGSHASIFALLAAKKERAGVFFDKGTLPSARTKWISSKCEYIVVMDQELGPPLENPLEHLVGWPSRIYPGTEEFIDKYLCVGPKTYQAALIRFSDTPEKVSLTGWPRVDIWRKLGFSIYKEEIQLIKKKHGSYLLFVSDFGLNEDENVYIEGLKCVSPTDLNFQKTLKSIRKWDLNPEIPKIVIRPHITEDKRLWEKVLGEVSKTEIHKEFNVTPWVLASEGIIHRGSTVALEAKLAGKDVFFLKESSKNEKNLFSDLLSDALVHSDFESPFPKIEGSKTSIPSALRDYVLIEEFDAVSRVVAELVSLRPMHELPTSKLQILFSQVRIKNLIRLAGLIKHEVNWKLGTTDQPPYSHCFPGGIKRKDFKKVLNSNETYLNVKVRALTFNCWEFDHRWSSKGPIIRRTGRNLNEF